MPEIIINGVPVDFPFHPYPVQEDYMKKVIECLQKGENGVLESPTGTGKTLSLLCSSLAWLFVKKAQLQATTQNMLMQNSEDFGSLLRGDLDKVAGVENFDNNDWGSILGPPKIIYSSRTHTQLSQVMTELKRTKYAHVKVTVLGSRDQLCIHPQVMKETNSAVKTALCRAYVGARSCHYYNNVSARKIDPTFSEGLVDIEDLVKRSQRSQCCPYYMAREIQKSADIIFMPYNYILDPGIRKGQDIQLRNSVVILDEGHNVEKVCEESASIQIGSSDIALCIGEVTQIMQTVHEKVTMSIDDSQLPNDFTLDDLCVIKTMLLELEKAVNNVELPKAVSGPDRGKIIGATFPGSYIFSLLGKAEIKVASKDQITDIVNKLVQFLMVTNDSLAKKGIRLSKFLDFLRIVFDSTGQDGNVQNTDAFYKVYIEPEVIKQPKNEGWISKQQTPVASATAKAINFWCFSPGFGMRSLLQQGVRCVLLTSGTLSPLQATIIELGIPVSVQLENPHVIKPNQICVTVVCKGPGNQELNSSFENRNNIKYLNDLGQTLLNFSRILPNGTLVFFPSYSVLDKCVKHWQDMGIWTKISNLKPVFVEPQQKDDLTTIMNEYYKALDEHPSHSAMLLAVCRGKISEGLDFSDKRCRSVIITGIPYPPFYDPRIKLKQEYVNQNNKGLNGRQWYQLEATRAVNQAIGRVIRHVNDYGAIILCDTRFKSMGLIKGLSAWLQPHVFPVDNFGIAFSRIRNFFRNMGDMVSSGMQQSVGASFDNSSVVSVRSIPGSSKFKSEEDDKQNEELVKLKDFLNEIKKEHPVSKQPNTDPSVGLLEALDTNSMIKPVYNPLTAKPEKVSRQGDMLPDVQRKRLKLVPLKFDESSSSESPRDVQSLKKKAMDYVVQVKRSINEKDVEHFKKAIIEYKAGDFMNTWMYLMKAFPNKQTHHLLRSFTVFLSDEHKKIFERQCNELLDSQK